MTFRNALKDCIFLAVISLSIYLYGNNAIPLTNPDEVFYMQTTKEMAQHQTWIVPVMFGQPQFEKPILSYWLFRASDLIFGPTPFAARFFPAVFGFLGVLAVYLTGLIGFKDRKAAFLSAIVLMTSGLYVGLSKTVFTDMFFSVFILGSFASFYWGYASPRNQRIGLLLCFIFSALAVLTKGPLGFLIPACAIALFLFLRRDFACLKTPYTLIGFALFLAIALPWYLFCVQKFGDIFTREFFYNDHIRRLLEAEHLENDRWYFYPGSIIFCMFPWSFFVLPALILFFRHLRLGESDAFELFLGCWIMVVFVIFQVAHSKLTSYIVPLFPAVALITGKMIAHEWEARTPLMKWMSWLTWTVFAIFPIVLIYAAYRYNQYITSMGPVFAFAALFLLFVAGLAYMTAKRKYLFYLAGVTAVIPLVFIFVTALHDGLDPYVSSKFSVEALLKNHRIENRILCSRFFVRGVHYYSNEPVATLDIGGKGFFSAHPIPYLNTDEKVIDFLKTQETTYGILKKSAVKHVGRIVDQEKWKMEVLYEIGDEFVVCIHAGPPHVFWDLKKFKKDDRVLILAPHPDDEAIATGGIIQRTREHGGKVKVVLFTNGDNNEFSFIVYEKRLTFLKGEFLHMGETRHKESLAAMASLGLTAKDVVSLGYPDFGTMEILTKYWGDTRPYRSMLTRQTKVAYADTLSPQAPYKGESVLKDLEEILTNFKPTKIFVSHPADTNRDHRALYLFTQIALWDVDGTIKPPEVFPYIIHVPKWPRPRGFHPEAEMAPPVTLTNNNISWKRFDLTDEEIENKRNAIMRYKSQNEAAPSYLVTFARRSELFSNYPVIQLPASPADSFEWRPLLTTHAGTKNKGRIREISYALRDKNLFIQLKMGKSFDKAFGIKMTLLNYRKGTTFSQMPKINIYCGIAGFKIRDKNKLLTSSDVELTQDGKILTFKIPLKILGNPQYILSSTHTQFGKLPVDDTAWRTIKINDG